MPAASLTTPDELRQPRAPSVFVAAVFVMLATLLRQLIDPLVDDNVPYATYFLALIAATRFGGITAGWAALFAGAAAAAYFFVPPRLSIVINGQEHVSGLITYFVMGGLILYVSDSMRKSTLAAQRATRESLERQRQLELETAERRRAEEQVRLEGERWRVTLSSIGDAVMTVSAEGRIQFMNPVAEAMTGWPLAEAANKDMKMVFNIVNEQSRTPVENPCEKVIREGVVVGLANHTILIRRDGTESPIEDSAAPIRESSGAIIGVILVFHDVSGKHKAEQALAESEQRFRVIADSAPVMIWMAGVDKRCSWFNRAWLEFTGRTTEQESGEGWVEGVHPEDRERAVRTYLHAFEQREEFKMEFRLLRFDGVYRWVFDHGVPRFSPEFAGYIGSCIDITERNEAEQERKRALSRQKTARADAEEASRLKDEFLATVSHELRTPLTPMLGWVRILRTRETRREIVEHGLEVIERNIRLQSRLVEDLLDVSRNIVGKLRLKLGPVSLSSVLDGAVESVQAAASAKGIKLLRENQSGDIVVNGDFDRLQQIVWNIVNNAIKFTPKNGTVTVRLAMNNSQAQIIVSDTGEGVAPDYLPRMFERFSQADSSAMRAHGGMGLGLAIVRHLVELHGGTVSATSPGKQQGTTVTVSLPIAAGSSLKSGDATLQGAPGKAVLPRLDGVKIMVVEDELDSREYIAEVLRLAGAFVNTAASASEAVEMLRQFKADVLVSDLGMPDEDGFSMLRRLRSMPHGRLPAIALTAYARDEDRLRAIEAGFQLHVAKPADPLVLAEAIGTVLRNNGASSLRLKEA